MLFVNHVVRSKVARPTPINYTSVHMRTPEGQQSFLYVEPTNPGPQEKIQMDKFFLLWEGLLHALKSNSELRAQPTFIEQKRRLAKKITEREAAYGYVNAATQTDLRQYPLFYAALVTIIREQNWTRPLGKRIS